MWIIFRWIAVIWYVFMVVSKQVVQASGYLLLMNSFHIYYMLYWYLNAQQTLRTEMLGSCLESLLVLLFKGKYVGF